MTMQAAFKVIHAGPSISVQDAGRTGYQRFGVSPSGPMDRSAFQLLNFALGRDPGAACIEVSLGGLEIECTAGTTLAGTAGGGFRVSVDGKRMPTCATFVLEAGMILSIRPGDWGSWCYLGFAGDIDAPSWLGSQSVHLSTGICGSPLEPGSELEVHQAKAASTFVGTFSDADTTRPDKVFRVVPGPQDRFFDAASIEAFFGEPFEITPEFNRMGMRLKGPELKITSSLDMPSEPMARGALQVPGHGDPIVLMADHQTTGGYPKIGAVISADQDKLAQLRPGDEIRFRRCDPAAAVRAARNAQENLERNLEIVAANKSSLEERLARSNLISGLVDANDPEVR